jgi:flagellar M-ring protein FliF
MAQVAGESRLRNLWINLTPGQRMMLGGTIVAIIAVVVVGSLIFSRAGYSVLYSGLAPEEAGQVVEKLEQRGVPYRLGGGGGTVMVPTGKVYAARIELASEGLPQSGTVGFEIFDKTVFGMTEFLQKVNYRRALEGELAKTISQMEEVEGVRVHIVVPERTLFRDEDNPATASVVIKSNPAHILSRKHIQGIAYLVASSVEGLEPDMVTILDSRGTLLSKGFSGGSVQPGDGLELKQQVEAYLEDKAQTLLDGVLGASKSVVRVSAVLNMERIDRSTERFDPESAIVISEERMENTNPTGGGGSESSVTNYEFDRTVETIAREVGNVQRLSVAVMVDGTYETEGTGPGATRRFIPRSDDELRKIAGIVKSAVGFDDTRNDYFEIASIAFDRTFLEEAEQGMEKVLKMQFYLSIARKAAYLGGLILALIIILKLVKKVGAIIGAASGAGASGGRLDIIASALPPAPRSGGGGQGSAATSEIATQIANLASRNPDQAAGVISSMVGGGN